MRGTRRPVLAPVLEHYEAPEGEEEEEEELTANSEFAQPTAGHCNNAAAKKCPMKSRILSKLRDGYVKLLSEVSWGGDFSGASSFYACPSATADHSDAFNARLRREKMARLQAARPEQQRTQQFRIIFTGA